MIMKKSKAELVLEGLNKLDDVSMIPSTSKSLNDGEEKNLGVLKTKDGKKEEPVKDAAETGAVKVPKAKTSGGADAKESQEGKGDLKAEEAAKVPGAKGIKEATDKAAKKETVKAKVTDEVELGDDGFPVEAEEGQTFINEENKSFKYTDSVWIEVIADEEKKKEEPEDNEDTMDEFEMEIVMEGDEVAVGDEALREGEPVEDGEYTMDELTFEVVDGKISKISDSENLSDVQKKIKRGKVIKLTPEQIRNKKKPRGGMSPKAYRARIQSLKKARRKSHTGSAKKTRAKSMKLRKRRIKDEGKVVEVNGLDMEKIGDSLRIFILNMLNDKFELTDEQSERMTIILSEAIPQPEMVEDHMVIKLPKWTMSDDEVNIEEYEQYEAIFSLEEEIDEESVISGITDDFDLGAAVFA